MHKTKFMFVFYTRKLKKFVVYFSIIILCLTLVFFVFSKKQKLMFQNSNISTIVAKDNNSRILFLNQNGWEPESEPTETIDITIPSRFNDTFKNYNNIQKSQGFDLEKYKGKHCKKYTYKILNYPDSSGFVSANIITFKNKIIGADIHCPGPDKFLKKIIKTQ